MNKEKAELEEIVKLLSDSIKQTQKDVFNVIVAGRHILAYQEPESITFADPSETVLERLKYLLEVNTENNQKLGRILEHIGNKNKTEI